MHTQSSALHAQPHAGQHDVMLAAMHCCADLMQSINNGMIQRVQADRWLWPAETSAAATGRGNYHNSMHAHATNPATAQPLPHYKRTESLHRTACHTLPALACDYPGTCCCTEQHSRTTAPALEPAHIRPCISQHAPCKRSPGASAALVQAQPWCKRSPGASAALVQAQPWCKRSPGQRTCPSQSPANSLQDKPA
jgi:hypothetical protein